MPSPTQLLDIQGALGQVNQAIPTVQASVGLTSDPNEKLQLTQLGILLTNIQTALTEAQIANANAIFAADTQKLKAQIVVLKKQQTDMSGVLKTVDNVGKVAGYIAQAVAFIGKL